MNIGSKAHTSIWYDQDQQKVFYIDQTLLPWELKIREMRNLDDAVRAISDMEVRGAPLIGVTAAFGMWLAAKHDLNIKESASILMATRPTAFNLKWAVEKMLGKKPDLETALKIRINEIDCSGKIGEFGLPLINEIAETKKGKPVNILTHCNAGWLACVEWGTATAPMYMAHDLGVPIHVWVDETRPRNQGAKLTAFELEAHGVPYTLIPDNTGGHLMQNGMVDMVIVGTDRVAANGDVANKIGTYLKALAAKDNNIPFFVAMPYSSFDPDTLTGNDITIEERSGDEVRIMNGFLESPKSFPIVPDNTPVANYGFDITPARLVSGYITEKGIKKKSDL